MAVLALLAPEAPANVLFDSLLTAFLLALSFCEWTAWLAGGQRIGALLLAAIAWSLAALSHAVFQLLPFFLIVLLYIPVTRRLGGRQTRRMLASLAVRKYMTHG